MDAISLMNYYALALVLRHWSDFHDLSLSPDAGRDAVADPCDAWYVCMHMIHAGNMRFLA